MDLLSEGVYDKGILKAVFMAGGPGSGKSYVAKNLFGIPDSINVSYSGLKTINSDTEFEYFLRKFGFDTETGAGYGKGTLDLDKWPKEVWDMVGGEASPNNPNLRSYTKQLTAMRKQGYMNGRLGMIIDGTARDVNKIAKEKKIQLAKHEAEQFYKVHETKPFYNDLCDYLSSGPIVVMVLQKENAIKKIRDES